MSESTGTNEITVEKLVQGGEGLARIDGRVVFLPFVLPGEVVEIEPTESKRDLLRARAVAIRQSSPHRVVPGCEYFGRCGGCQLQHAAYEEQTLQKAAILREVLERIGKIKPPERIDVVRGPEWAYRNRVQLHFEPGIVGYREAGSHRLCPVDHCPISSPKINEVIGAFARMAKDTRFPPFLKTLEVFTNESDVQLNVLETDRPVARHFFEWCADEIPGVRPGAIEYEGAGHLFQVGHRSFFQVNRFLLNELVTSAIDGAGEGLALDLYAGVGLFSLPLAARGDVTAVEAGTSAINDLVFNAGRAGIKLAAVRSDAAVWLSTAQARYDFILADPPRAGLGRAVVEQLIRLKPKRLNIVACDQATLARDLQRLTANGFEIERITMMDLFPQTSHIESITYLASG